MEKAGDRLDISTYTGAVEQYGDMVFRLAFSYTRSRNDAEDCCQNVFIKLFRREAAFTSEDHMKAWLINAIRHECTDLFRSVWRKRVDLTEEMACFNAGEDASPEETGVLAQVLSLSALHRECLILHYYEGYSLSEIARLLRTKESTVRVRLMRAREALKKALAKAEYSL